MSPARNKVFLFIAFAATFAGGIFLGGNKSSAQTTPAILTQPVISAPASPPTPKIEITPFEDDPLKDSIIAAGDYLARQQLPNGELSYQVDIFTGERVYSPSHVRLMAGTGALFTVCRISGDLKYCNAGDLALDHYLELLVSEPAAFKGTCLYTEGNCQLGGAALTVDSIYKRWQATGGYTLGDRNLLHVAIELGYFILSMRKPDGDFYHAYDPYFGGTADPDFFVTYSSSESLVALLQLYEMTANDFWLTQARDVNDFMVKQPVTEDQWHAIAFSMLARLDKLTKTDMEYTSKIAHTVIDGEVRSLNPVNTSISTATKVEALATIAQALYIEDEGHAWLDPELGALITFVRARQLPDNNCGWEFNDETIRKYGGGVISSCDQPYIRVDGLQHWINGAAAYLEYQIMIEKRR